jgi:hypothetical protein
MTCRPSGESFYPAAAVIGNKHLGALRRAFEQQNAAE